MSTFVKYPPLPSIPGSGVLSVNGQVGVVVLLPSDLGLGSADNVTFGSVTANNLTANRAVVTDGAKKLVSSTATNTEVSYLSGVLSAIQPQIDGKQATGNYITALTGDVTATGPGSAVATIPANTVSNAKLAQMAANTIKGNNTGGTANALDLTTAQTTAMLDLFVGDTTSVAGTKGLVSAPAAGRSLINSVLKADNTFSNNFPILSSQEAIRGVSTWISKSAPAANQWFALCWAPEIRTFCSIASNGTNRVMISSDGTTWTAQSAAANNTWTDVAWSPTLRLFAAVAFDGTTADNIMTSPDGVTWTSRTSPAAQQWYSICWSEGLGLFCASSLSGTDRMMTSPDGINWTPRTPPSAQWYNVCWGDAPALFVAVALGGSIITSPDGTTWTSRTGVGASDWYDVTYSTELGLYCAVGITGTFRVMTSPNGINWTGRTASLAAAWRRVEWSKRMGIFVAVSSGGDVMSSPDGITWTTRTAAAANQWYGLAFADDLQIFAATAITGTDRVMVSTYISGFNTSGLTGATGATGATGPAGPTGPAAASGEMITSSVTQTVQQTTTSAAFVDIPGLSTTVTSTLPSKIEATLNSVLQCSAGLSAQAEIRLVIDAQNGATTAINISNTTDKKNASSSLLSTQLAAGTYTVKAQYRETGGLGTLALNSGVLFAQVQQTAGPYSMSQASELREDWVSSTSAGNTGWLATLSTGTATTVTTGMTGNNIGVLQLATGASATGRAAVSQGTLSQFFGGGTSTTEMLVQIPALSTGVQEYTLRLGFGDVVAGTDMVDGVYFEYDRTASVNWRLKTANNSVRSVVDSGVAVAINVWVKLAFVVNAGGTSVSFYINGTLAGTIGTNIPVAVARACAPTLIITKTVGATTALAFVDYFYNQTVFTSPR